MGACEGRGGGGGGGSVALLPGMGGSRLTGLAVVGEEVTGVGRLLGGAGDAGRPMTGCAGCKGQQMAVLHGRWVFQNAMNKTGAHTGRCWACRRRMH